MSTTSVISDDSAFDDLFAEEEPQAAATTQSQLPVELPSNTGHSYNLLVGDNLLQQAGSAIITACSKVRKVVVVADRDLPTHYVDTVVNSLFGEGLATTVFPVAAGDQNKNFMALMQLTSDILASGIDRQTVLLAIGGGVTGDLGGFAASMLLRGIRYVQVPTSLLAQVDSSIGGKTGINTGTGKNLLGAFWQPSLVLMDTSTLQTLPNRELRAGYAEILKYGVLGDADFFNWLQDNGQAVLDLDPAAIQHAVLTSCRMKRDIVVADEREQGVRALLNLGHTFGHALEAVLQYDDRLLHGEAVALGMLLAADLSVRLGMCDAQVLADLTAHQEQLSYPIKLPTLHDWSIDDLMQAMQKDKKASEGNYNLVLLEDMGKAVVKKNVEAAAIVATWEAFL